MIVLRKERAIILTPPRTASVSLHHALCGPNIWVHGPIEFHAHMPMAHETRSIPADFAKFKLACVVRNPLHRLVSMYCLVRDWRPRLPASDWTFSEFAERAANPPQHGWWPAWGRSISDYLRPLRSMDYILRFESLEADLLRTFGIDVKLPRTNSSNRLPFHEYYQDQRVLELARKWAEEDCRAFGYDANP